MTRRTLLVVVLVRFLSLFTLRAVQIASDKTSRGVPSDSSFEQVRNFCDIAAIKSRWNRSWFTRAILKLQLRRDKNCIELRDKNRLCKRAFIVTFVCSTNWSRCQNWLIVSVSQRDTFVGPRKKFSHSIIWSVSLKTIVVSAWKSMYQWAFCGLEIS